MLHEDKILNKLYKKMAKIAEQEPENYDKIFGLLDEITDRRLELGEITEEELELI